MNKKMIKLITILVTIMFIMFIGISTVSALTPVEVEPIETEGTGIEDFGGKLLGILQTVGIILSVLVITILGIKYMMGSAEEKAEYKKTMIPYIVGAACIFLAPTIANIVYSFFKS